MQRRNFRCIKNYLLHYNYF